MDICGFLSAIVTVSAFGILVFGACGLCRLLWDYLCALVNYIKETRKDDKNES